MLLSAEAARANTCTAPVIDDITHQGARVQWMNDVVSYNQRIQYGTTTSYGSTQYPYSIAYVNPSTLYQGYSLAGLQPSTTYHVLAQTADATGAWCAGVDATFTTLATPANHGISMQPAAPTPASGSIDGIHYNVPLNTIGPPPVTGTYWSLVPGSTAVTDATHKNCPDFQTCLNDALFGDEIILPAGLSNAVHATAAFVPPPAPDAYDVPFANINLTASTLTTSAPAGWIVNGTAVRMGSPYYLPSPLQMGQTYYLVNVSGNTFQLAKTAGGAPITFLNVGLGDTYVLPWPMTQFNWITIRTSAIDLALPPVGSRLNSQDPNFAFYQSSLAYILGPPALNGTGQSFMNWAGGALAHNYYFIGVATEAAADPNAASETDPAAAAAPWFFSPQNNQIVLDRCWIHGLGYPNRVRGGIQYFDGSNMALINSSVDNMTFWRPYVKTGDEALTIYPSNVTIGPGSFHMGWTTCTNSTPATLNVTGGSPTSSYVYIYWTAAPTCTLTASVPSGLAASGSGITVVTNTSPGWPLNASGRNTGGEVAVLTLSGATVSSGYSIAGYAYSIEETEGAFAIDVSRGPGPTMLDNNYIEGTGIASFWSDDASMSGACYSSTGATWYSGVPGSFPPFDFCALAYTAADSTLTRNTFTTLLTHMAGGPLSDGRRYSHRNLVEWKTGQRVLFKGNVVSNNWSENNAGPAVLWNTNSRDIPNGIAASVNEITDVEASYNTLTNNADQFDIGGHQPDGYDAARSVKRVYLHDNLVEEGYGYSLNTVAIPGAVSSGLGAWGVPLKHLACPEDLREEHNTFFNLRGNLPFGEWWIGQPCEGFVTRNNLFWWNSDNSYVGLGYSGPQFNPNVPDPTGLVGTALLAALTPIANVWDHNVVVGGWSNSSALVSIPSSYLTGTLSPLYPASPGTNFVAGADVPTRLATLHPFNSGFGAENLRWHSSSPYISGGSFHASDGSDIGVHLDALDVAQGNVSNVHAFGISSTALTVGFVAPDANGCPVDWSINNWATYHRANDAGGANRVRAIAITGVTAHANVAFRVDCQTRQPYGAAQLP